jgi:signal transduction histidine kinase
MEMQRLAVNEEIASSIVHDIRNLLTTIQTLIEIQKSYWNPEAVHSAEVRVKLANSSSKIQNAVDRILAIVKVIQSNIRDASESKKEKLRLEPRLQQIQFFPSKKLEGTNIELIFDRLPKDFEFLGNSVKVTQILTNLIECQRCCFRIARKMGAGFGPKK